MALGRLAIVDEIDQGAKKKMDISGKKIGCSGTGTIGKDTP
jgi:hypothetical protein